MKRSCHKKLWSTAISTAAAVAGSHGHAASEVSAQSVNSWSTKPRHPTITNFEIMPEPPLRENKLLTWPDWPLKLRTSSSHEEGVERDFAVLTTKFSGENGEVKKLHCVRVDSKIKPVPGTEFELDADLVLLAMGFVHPVHEGMIETLEGLN